MTRAQRRRRRLLSLWWAAQGQDRSDPLWFDYEIILGGIRRARRQRAKEAAS